MARLGGRSGRAIRRGGLLPVAAVLLLAGCASMPNGGEVRKADDGQTAGADAQVQVYGIPPQPGESPSEIVSGFLEATTSGEPDFATAKKYLATSLRKHWNPLARITVLSDRRNQVGTDTDPDATSATVDVDGHRAAVVDTKRAYEPAHGDFHTQVHLVRQHGEWRIDQLDDGLVLSASDFKRIYHSVNLYYFADLGADAHRTDGGPRQTLVADPVYLRQQLPDALATTVSALLGGPTKWLAPAVASAAPPGTALFSRRQGESVTLDDSQSLKVRLNKAADKLHGEQCTRLAAQLFATVQGQASVRLKSVEVLRADGSTACEQTSAQAQDYGPGNLVGASAERYFIGAEHQLYELPSDGGTKAAPVAGDFGVKAADLGSVAVRRDERMAAGVKRDGKHLVVGSLDGGELQASALVSGAKDPKNGLSAPSWDGFGDLWVADRNPAVSKLYVLPDGTGQPAEVAVPQLDGRIDSLRVASDGIRIAMVVERAGTPTLQLGRIERGGTPTQPSFSVQGLRDLTAGQSVTSVSWAGPSRLVVLGSDAGGGQQIQYVSTDGSTTPAQLGSIGEAVSVAASESPGRPLLASYGGSVYWLPDDSNWKRVTPKGDSPVYPG
jgi:hypothetical protein